MNSLERVLAAINSEPVDRTPVLPVMLMQGSSRAGDAAARLFRAPDAPGRGTAPSRGALRARRRVRVSPHRAGRAAVGLPADVS